MMDIYCYFFHNFLLYIKRMWQSFIVVWPWNAWSWQVPDAWSWQVPDAWSWQVLDAWIWQAPDAWSWQVLDAWSWQVPDAWSWQVLNAWSQHMPVIYSDLELTGAECLEATDTRLFFWKKNQVLLHGKWVEVKWFRWDKVIVRIIIWHDKKDVAMKELNLYLIIYIDKV